MEPASTNNTSRPKVAVVLLCWNCVDDIQKCIPSLQQMDYDNFCIVAVDNHSTDGTADTIERLYPEAVLIRNDKNLGAGGGYNTGAWYALEHGADYVWFLNADTVVEPDLITKVVAAGEADPTVGLLSPGIYYLSDRTRLQNCGGFLDWSRFLSHILFSFEELDSIDPDDLWLPGTTLFIKRAVLEKIGAYDEKYFAYCEDRDYSMTARAAGFKRRIVRAAKIYHRYHSVDFREVKKLPPHVIFFMTRNVYFFWMKHLKGFSKVRYFFHYVSEVFDKLGHYKEDGCENLLDVVCDAFYFALRNIDGPWDRQIQMPALIRKCFCACPFLVTDLLNGRFGAIANRIFCGRSRKTI